MPDMLNKNKLVPNTKMRGFRSVGFRKAFLFFSLVMILIGLFLTSALVDQTVIFSDKNLELAIRDILGYSGKPIHQSQLSNIRSLDLSNKEITDLTGIEHFRNLEELNLSYNNINNLSKLKSLYKLRILNLENNEIFDLEAAEIDQLKFLRELNLRETSSGNFNVL